MVMSKEELEAFEAQRDIAAELLQAAEEIRDNRPSAVMVPTEDGQYVRSEVARVRSSLLKVAEKRPDVLQAYVAVAA